MPEYEIVRSNRKTLALYVRRDGRVEVRAPMRTSLAFIEDFVLKKKDWIENSQKELLQRQDRKKIIRLTEEEATQYKKQARVYLSQKCRQFSAVMGLEPSGIRINSARTRWGSCNRKGSINFTYRLLLLPEEIIDYIVVHELAHLKEMNHSARFWSVVEQTMPDYKIRRKKLREFELVELVIE